MNHKLPILFLALLLAACASPQTASLPPDHPANPDAPEAAATYSSGGLGIDATTRATQAQFANAKDQGAKP